ncbi:OmpW family outer membrane protein [Glaciimonas sp. CA11.2]|uniref:OmpW/AlkL family protein n=1 Tax=unclassified Glaciimonas TaxID=2644401 RepID=UPI002AB3D1AB|nr:MULTISPECIES: OmpW family outer membrane protein [unclassified Glaciimonas]MDY7545179.1 OmpW family outer membrane protein [Glaciimonas sp. CA11.2]MEB0011323.1 OmpW family outer membrane protein [Glaciimonas sp. Cout2]MEB0080973.1 OmpW family outer membrane protein [Glaciimonas sp. Gout2]MEB0164441.1 OmpW family outer membrane protein [Glaciimonas sp. CA11.2]
MKVSHCLAALTFILISSMAAAQKAGDTVVNVGGLYINNSKSSSTPLHTDLGVSLLTQTTLLPQKFDSPGTNLRVGNAVTPLLTVTHFVTDHFAITNVAGLPPSFNIYGSGKVTTPGALGAAVPPVVLNQPGNAPLASVLQWSPTLLFQYYFRDPKATFRPYLGAGVSYNFFTHVKLNDNFNQELKNTGGYLAFASTGSNATTIQAKATSSFRPVLNGGLNINFDDNWSGNLGVSYLPLQTDSIITVKDKNGNTVLTSTARLNIPAIATNFTLGYKF